MSVCGDFECGGKAFVPPLTIEQRAKRRATRINNKAKRELPLLAGTPAIETFLVTPESQVSVVEQALEDGRRWLEKQEQAGANLLARAEAYKQELIELLDMDRVGALQRELEDRQSRWPALQQPEYVADYWGTILRNWRAHGQ